MKVGIADLTRCAALSCVCLGLWASRPAAAKSGTVEHSAISPYVIRYDEARLRAYGYDPNDLNSLQKAAANGGYGIVRAEALNVLAARMGAGAAPLLKQALNDPAQIVRCSSATWLAVLGDNEGLARLRKDLADLTPKNTTAQIDQATEMNESQRIEAKKTRTLNLQDALDAGRVLSEFGDRSAYDLAVRVTQGDELTPARSMAIHILANISNTTDLAVLKSENRDPDGALLALAARERNASLIRELHACALILRRSEAAMKIFDALLKSPYTSETERKDIERNREYRRQSDSKRPKLPAGPEKGENGKQSVEK